jgi:hypothetical protein
MPNIAGAGDNATILQIHGDNNSAYIDVGANRTLKLSHFLPDGTQSPASNLSPYNRVTRFIGRQAELESLAAWLSANVSVSVRVLIGRPGLGKTRLAMEAATRADGWTTGFVTSNELRRFANSASHGQWEWNDPTLVIVDYAEQKADELSFWISELSDRFSDGTTRPKHKLRILLIEREAALSTGWFSEVFGSTDTFSNRRFALCDPQVPVVLEPIDRSSSHEIIDATRLTRSDTDGTSRDQILKYLKNGSDIDQVIGNPLMLQIAALQDWSKEKIFSRVNLLTAVVNRERAHMVNQWRNARIKQFLIPHLLQLTALVCLNGGASTTEIVRILDECEAFRLLGRTMSVGDILEALKPILRDDGSAIIRAIEPDLVGDLFIAQSELAPSTVVWLIKVDPYAIGRRLWRILEDFGEDEGIAQRLTAWIEAYALQEDNSVALDTFSKACGRTSRRVAHLLAIIIERIVGKLKAGGQTADTLLVGETGRLSIIAYSLLREAGALSAGNRFDQALVKIDEAKSLYKNQEPGHDIVETIKRIDLEVSCCRALGNKVRLLAAL